MAHSTTTRRTFLGGCLAGASLAAVLADPERARAAAATTRPVTLTLADGRTVSAALARLPGAAPSGGVILIHEWWGLNDQIRSVAVALAEAGYTALAVDLYDGQTASDRDGAMALMKAVDTTAATLTLVSWLDWLKVQPHASGKLATLGWCFGGGWSLNASIASPVDGTVVYYGRVDRSADQLKRLKGPVLGHFATRDASITRDVVERFEAGMREAGRPYTIYWYDADHAFANPTGSRFDADDAQLAWTRTLHFLRDALTA